MSNDGGPAFPCEYDVAAEWPDNPKPGTLYPINEHVVARGMSLRDWFAGQIINGWYATYGLDQAFSNVDVQANAHLAYRQADAMLAERERGK